MKDVDCLPQLSTSSSSLSSTFSDVSSLFLPSSPPSSASKTHAFFASPFSTRSHSPEPVLRQQAPPTPDISSTPVPPSNLERPLQPRPSRSGLRGANSSSYLDKNPSPIHRNLDGNLEIQTWQSPCSSADNEPTPKPTNALPILVLTGAAPYTSETSPTSPETHTGSPFDVASPPPLSSSTSTSSTTSDSSTSLQTFITGQNTDTTLRLLRTLGQGSFSLVWLAEDLSPLPLSLKAKRGLRELREHASRDQFPQSLSHDPSIDHRFCVENPENTVDAQADVVRNASLKRLRARVRGTKPSRGNIRLRDGTYLVDERDGEMGSVSVRNSSDSDTSEVGLGASLARVGSLSGKVTNVSPTENSLRRRTTTRKSSGRLVAVKLTPRGARSQREAEKERVAFVREVEVLRHISHPNITPLLSHLSTPTHYVLVFPYLPGGDLLALVNSDVMWSKLGEDVVRRIWCELCKAVGWMHGVGLVHRDIKLENILLTTSVFRTLSAESPRPTLDMLPAPPTPLIRLNDFGLSRFVELYPSGEAELLAARCGSEAYAAPELVTGGGRPRLTRANIGDTDKAKSIGVYDARETDAWACGVVLYTLVIRRLPFGEGIPSNDVVDMDGGNISGGGGVNGRRVYDRTERRKWLMCIAKGEYSWPEFENRESGIKEEIIGPKLAMSRDARRIVEKLLVRDPGKRSRIADLWSDPWMKGTGIDKDFACATTSANAEHDFVDELGSLELQQDSINNCETKNLDNEKCWLEDEELEKLEKEEEEDGAWLVDEHGIHTITRQELA
ncbi:hypothetical protein AX15_004971 [Amanita polypyramis BW_CC]|nr:hypothetical protein AX15_004971 [Amanita polypyramis BW_CC]